MMKKRIIIEAEENKKEDLNGKALSVSWIGKLKMFIVIKLFYKLDEIFIRIPFKFTFLLTFIISASSCIFITG